MIPYIGDFAEDASVVHYFNTFDSNDPTVSSTLSTVADTDLYVYKDGNIADIVTDGATIVIDFDGRTGVNKLTIDTSIDAAYAIGSDYMVIIEGGTVDLGTPITAAIFTFSIENRYNAAADDLANATDGLTALKALIDTMQGNVTTIASDVANVDGYNLATQIGTAGAGLTNVGASGNDWNTVVPDVAGTAPTAAEIETEVWDGLQSAHVVANSMGIIASEIATIDGKVDTAQTDLNTITGTAGVLIGTDAANVTEISDAVWDEATSAHSVVGSFGASAKDVLTDTADIQPNYATEAKQDTAQTDLNTITGTAGVLIGTDAANVTEISDAVWDEPLTAAEHNTSTSAGKRLRQVQAAFVITEGTADAGGAATIDLETATASTTTDIYRGDRVLITGGTGVGEHGIVVSYEGVTNQRCTMAENWVVQPDNTSIYEISPASVDIETVQHATQTAGDLAALIATAQTDLDTITGTAGVLIGTDAANVTEISDAVWDEDATGHQTQGTFGQAIGDPVADATTIYQSVATDATGDNVAVDVVAVKAETVLIVADTGELQADDYPTTIAALQTDLDTLTDAYTEPTGVPGVSETMAAKVGYLYMALRNKVTVTATKKTFFDDGDAAEWEKDLSDDTTTYTETEGNAI